MGGRLTDGRPASRRGPLVAQERPRPAPGRRGAERSGSGLARFVRRHGWRAYAIPVLALATLAVVVDLVLNPPGSASTAAGPAPATTAPAAPSAEAPTGPSVEPAPPAEGDAGPVEIPAPVTAEQYVEQGTGDLVLVDGGSDVLGTGPLQRFVVEVEDGIGVDGVVFAEAVTTTLADPRSWGNGGRMSFQRVGIGAEHDFRVSLVSPGSMETYCPGVGTGGYTSCRYGDRAVINLARWATAVPHYDGDLATYRRYVVNHEVGHVLGNGHEQCPGPGRLAPVMQQQTLDLGDCVRNAWPHP
ncbi:DUF3152 domain-containing protein [Blastococcus sp. HT6-30]|uniref:DUF3152 domain-containing protein n=1 Tax=Blastococcus sp. HT6-30 TaxID=3144843 RepID=UPI00321A22FA